MTAAGAALIDGAVWAGWGIAVGATAASFPATRFARDGRLTRLRRWERDGRTWERIGIRRWKDRLPVFDARLGGLSKRRLPARDRIGLESFAAETRRAEWVHWIAAAPLLMMPAWNPDWLLAVMTGYAVAANAPFIAVQRYNRARIERILTHGASRRRRPETTR
jgi:glycosyl-4,4'-diaponeurosporenoate acyltransferase